MRKPSKIHISYQKAKEMRNRKMSVLPFVVEALGTDLRDLERKSGEVDI